MLRDKLRARLEGWDEYRVCCHLSAEVTPRDETALRASSE
jgi:hypothetical protein